MQDAGKFREMLLGVFAAAVARIEKRRRWWIGPTKRPVVAHTRPHAAGDRFAFGEHRHGRVIAMQTLASEDVLVDQHRKRGQRRGAAADVVGERRSRQIDAFTRIAVRLTVERLMLPIFLKQDHRQQAGTSASARDHMERAPAFQRNARNRGMRISPAPSGAHTICAELPRAFP